MMFRQTPDVYSVQYLVSRKERARLQSSQIRLMWMIAAVLLVVSVVTIAVVLAVVFTRLDNSHALFEGKPHQPPGTTDTSSEAVPVKAAHQHEAEQKDMVMSVIHPSGVSPSLPSNDQLTKNAGGLHLHPVIAAKKIHTGSRVDWFMDDPFEVEVLEMTMTVPPSIDVTSLQFEEEVAEALEESFKTGEERQAESNVRRRKRAIDPSTVTVNITHITLLPDGKIVVDFFIVENGKIVGSTDAILAFNQLTPGELEQTLKAKVVELYAVSASTISFVGMTEIPSTFLASSDVSFTLLSSVEASPSQLTDVTLTSSTYSFLSSISPTPALPSSSVDPVASSSAPQSLVSSSPLLSSDVIPTISPSPVASSSLQTEATFTSLPYSESMSFQISSTPDVTLSASGNPSLPSSSLQGSVESTLLPSLATTDVSSSIFISLDSSKSTIDASSSIPVTPSSSGVVIDSSQSAVVVSPTSTVTAASSGILSSSDAVQDSSQSVVVVSPTSSVIAASSGLLSSSDAVQDSSQSVVVVSPTSSVIAASSGLLSSSDAVQDSSQSVVVVSPTSSVIAASSGLLSSSDAVQDSSQSVVVVSPTSSVIAASSGLLSSSDAVQDSSQSMVVVSPTTSATPASSGILSSSDAVQDSSQSVVVVSPTTSATPASSGILSSSNAVQDSSHSAVVVSPTSSVIAASSGLLSSSDAVQDSSQSAVVVSPSVSISLVSSDTLSSQSLIEPSQSNIGVSRSVSATVSSDVLPSSVPLSESIQPTTTVSPSVSQKIASSDVPSSSQLLSSQSTVVATPTDSVVISPSSTLPSSHSSSQSNTGLSTTPMLSDISPSHVLSLSSQSSMGASITISDISSLSSMQPSSVAVVPSSGVITLSPSSQITPSTHTQTYSSSVVPSLSASHQSPGLTSSQSSQIMPSTHTQTDSSSVVPSLSASYQSTDLRSSLQSLPSSVMTATPSLSQTSHAITSQPYSVSATGSIVPSASLPTSSVVVTSSTPVTPEPNLLQIKFTLDTNEDVNSDAFRQRIAAALKEAFLAGRNRQTGRRRKRQTSEENPLITIKDVFSVGNVGVVHFSVSNIDPSLTVHDILEIYRRLDFEEMKTALGVELLPPGVELVNDVTIPSTMMTISLTLTSLLLSTKTVPFSTPLDSSTATSESITFPTTSIFLISSSSPRSSFVLSSTAQTTISSELPTLLTSMPSTVPLSSTFDMSSFSTITSLPLLTSSLNDLSSSSIVITPSLVTSLTNQVSSSSIVITPSLLTPSTNQVSSSSSVITPSILTPSTNQLSSSSLVIDPSLVTPPTNRVSSSSSVLTPSLMTTSTTQVLISSLYSTFPEPSSSTVLSTSLFPSSIPSFQTSFSGFLSLPTTSFPPFTTSPPVKSSISLEIPVSTPISTISLTPSPSTTSGIRVPSSMSGIDTSNSIGISATYTYFTSDTFTLPSSIINTMTTVVTTSALSDTPVPSPTLPTSLKTDSSISGSAESSSIFSVKSTDSIMTLVPTAIPSRSVISSALFSSTMSISYPMTRVTVSTEPSESSLLATSIIDSTTSSNSNSGLITEPPTATIILPKTTLDRTASTPSQTPSQTVSSRPTTDLPSSTLLTVKTATPTTPSTTSIKPTLPTATQVVPTPTPTTMPPPKPTPSPDYSLSRLTIQVRTVVNVDAQPFSAYIENGLEKSYVEAILFGKLRRKKRQTFGTATGNYTVVAQATDVKRESETPERVLVDFYVVANNQDLEAERVSSTLNRLTLSELSAIITYPVLEPVRPVSAPVTEPVVQEEPQDNLLVILAIVIPSLLVIIAIILFLIWYCRNSDVSTGTTVAKETETLGHHNLDVDIEKGDIVQKSLTWKSTGSGSLTLKKKSTPLAIEVEDSIEPSPHEVLMGTAPTLSRSSSFERYIPNPDTRGRRNYGYVYNDDSLSLPDRHKEVSYYQRAGYDSRETLDPCYSPISEFSIQRSPISTPVTEMEVQEEQFVQNSPSTFANVAKMTRIVVADSISTASEVKYRPLDSDNHDASKDISGSILEDRADFERHRNKQRQRAKLRQLEEENNAKNKESPKVQHTLEIGTQPDPPPEINGLRRQEIGTQPDPPPEINGLGRQEIETPPEPPPAINGHDRKDRTKLGRNMRARPRRPDKKEVEQNEPLQQPLLNPEADSATPLETLYFSPTVHPAYSTPSGHVVAPQTNPLIESPQHPTQDLLETLNRQQHLVSNPLRAPSTIPETDDAKRRAQLLLNDSFLLEQIQEHRRKQEQMKEMNQLLSDAFPLANSGIINGDIEVTHIANGELTNSPVQQSHFHRLHLNGGDSNEAETDSLLLSGQDRQIPSSNFAQDSSGDSPLTNNQMNGHEPAGFDPHEMNPRLRKAIRGELRKPQPTKL